jgi:hypothetical protein
MSREESVILRDLIIFQIKLVMDGLKDIVLAPVSIVAAIADLLLPGTRRGHRFYAVMRVGERFDRWLNLFAAAERAGRSDDGLLGSERADPDSMLGRIESILFDDGAEPGRTSAGPAA